MGITPIIQAWFKHACQHLEGVVDACVYLGEADSGMYSQLLVSSDQFNQRVTVLDSVNAVLKRRKAVVSRVHHADTVPLERASGDNSHAGAAQSAEKNYLVCCPIIIDKQLHGAVCFEFSAHATAPSVDYLGQVNSAVNWLVFCTQTGVMPSTDAHASLALKIVALSISQENSLAAATAVMTELANKLSCDRVSVGFLDSGEMHIFALSHSANFEAKQNILKDIRLSMREAMDQHETLVYPGGGESHFLLQAHRDLSIKHGSANICTVPLLLEGDIIGGVVFERSNTNGEFTDDTVELCEQLAALFAPVLEYRRQHDRPVLRKIRDIAGHMLKNVMGSEYIGMKLASVFVVAFSLLMIFVQWEYKVSANAVLEGSIERVITAPEAGYIQDATARPGDVVKAEQVLASLDDKDLKLEKLKWEGKEKEVSKEYREALASHDRSKIGIIRAQLEQAEAEINILDKKLDRTVISAPIDGVVVSGDFTRSLGAPVEKGQILYTVSPLDQYRILLDIDENEISEITVGMKGELTLSAAAEDVFEIVVERITPVSNAADGINYFQVEATLLESHEFLRPGMQGVGKISIGERQLFWIWTHKMFDWLRLVLWTWI